MDPRAQALIADLQLQPHPEGGFYREIFRSPSRVQPQDARATRAALTTIYFLLPAGAHSRWHRVASDEVWHLYEGGPLELVVADTHISATRTAVLQSAAGGAGPVHTVAAGEWQAARPLGSFALCGCTVGPGFEFEDFSFLRDQPALAARLRVLAPEAAAMI